MPIATKGSSIEVSNLKVLKNFAYKVAKDINTGDSIFLYGQLGVGKTTFTRFLINYLQKKTKSKVTEIPSPTFTIMYEYMVQKRLIQHYDFYRIESHKEINNIGIFEDKNVITLVEWPEKIKFKPKNRIELRFNYSKNYSCRIIKIKFYGNCKKYEI